MNKAQAFQKRRTGILLHITSLPSGKLGEDAYHFVDLLEKAGVSVWQMLPLGPTHSDGSPYQCLSAHAANTKLICLKTLKQQPWVNAGEIDGLKRSAKMAQAYYLFIQRASEQDKKAFNDFVDLQQYWLEDYVLFCEIRLLQQQTAWFQWPITLRDRSEAALQKVRTDRENALNIRRFEQFIFAQQWQALKSYANQHGVLLFGDMPIFVAHDSADVWANPELFALDSEGQTEKVAGVPPDYFSATGQRWGNPLYRWEEHSKTGFLWWQRRLQTQLDSFDLIRLDHFRGFEACWEIPAECETAIDGQWVTTPGDELFKTLLNTFGELPLVAEDLGIITDEVTALREKYGMPGMKILQFAFGGDATNPYLPHQHCRDSVAYTGTHDNDTTVGWFDTLDEVAKTHVYDYFGETAEAMPWLLIRAVLRSVSQLAVLPMQDLLSLNGKHRMNVPGTSEGNWMWRFEWAMVDEYCVPKLRRLNELYGRS